MQKPNELLVLYLLSVPKRDQIYKMFSPTPLPCSTSSEQHLRSLSIIRPICEVVTSVSEKGRKSWTSSVEDAELLVLRQNQPRKRQAWNQGLERDTDLSLLRWDLKIRRCPVRLSF